VRIAFDAAYPPSTVPAGATTACIYAGGDTPNPIADPSTVPVYAQVRYWLPVWVRSNPTTTQGGTDATAMLAWLRRVGAPAGTATALDIETAVTPAYVNAYGGSMHAAGYKVLVYGSRSTLDRNPALDGYFSAHPGATSLDPACVATQYDYAGTYDLSWITDTVPLWDAHPPQTPATPAPTPAAGPVTARLEVRNGHGWLPLPETWHGVYVVGTNPDVTGSYLGPMPIPVYVSLTPGNQTPHGVVVFSGADGTFEVIFT
jgi:hypothetical protein